MTPSSGEGMSWSSVVTVRGDINMDTEPLCVTVSTRSPPASSTVSRGPIVCAGWGADDADAVRGLDDR